MDQRVENDLTEVEIEYPRIARFFDKKFVKRYTILFVIGGILAALGGAIIVVNLLGHYSLFMLQTPGWISLVIGAVILSIAFSRIVKESEIRDICEIKEKRFLESCWEKLDYPEDKGDMSILLHGYQLDDGKGQMIRRLKAGNYIGTEPTVTLLYIHTKKKELAVFTSRFSLVENKEEKRFETFSFSDFEKAEIVPEKINDQITSYRFLLKNGEKILSSSPMTHTDYYIDEFLQKIAHSREKL
jgi:hypothetical protein